MKTDDNQDKILFILSQVMSIFDGMARSYIIINSDEKIVAYNEMSAKIDGLRASSVINRKLLEVFPNLSRSSSSMIKVLYSGVPIWNKPQNYLTPEGKHLSLTSSIFPILDSQQCIRFVIEVVHDISILRGLTDAFIHLTETLTERSSLTLDSNQIVTNNKNFKDILDQAICFAKTQLPVMISGETGTGKELIARFIHENSNTPNEKIITINCGAIPPSLIESTLFGTVKGAFSGAENKKGLLELADGGTLFLDEINSMPIEVQSKFLRVVQDGMYRSLGGNKEKKVIIRYITALNELPDQAIKNNHLRPDLYYRLGVCLLTLPPLRKRLDDIGLLVDHFIHKHAGLLNIKIKGYELNFIQYLQTLPWPGNIRMLENMVLRSMLLCSQGNENIIKDKHVKIIEQDSNSHSNVLAGIECSTISTTLENKSLSEHLEWYEKKLIEQEMNRYNGNKSEVARQLGLPRTTLQSKLKRFSIVI